MRWCSFLLFTLLFLLSACFSRPELSESEKTETKFIDFEIKYAKGFSSEFGDSKKRILIHEPSTGEVIDTLNITGSNDQNYGFFTKIVAQSTTHFAFLRSIAALNSLQGLCGTKYLSDEQQNLLISTQEICNAQGLDIEKIVALNPDLVFLYPFGDQDKIKLNRLGIRNVYLTEYLESSALARAEWLKFFAIITGKSPKETDFEHIEKSYLSLVNEVNEKNKMLSPSETSSQTVVFNLPFGENWDMPSGNSITAKLVQDAGFDYKLSMKQSLGNLTFKFEEAYQHVSQADYWIIIAARSKDFSLSDLISENPIYGLIPAVLNRKVFFCNTDNSPYFSEGPIEPHVLLQDLIACKSGKDEGNKYFKIL